MHETTAVRWMAVLTLAVAGLGLAGCSCQEKTTHKVHGTGAAPGVDAKITVTPKDSGNYKVAIDAANLPPPKRLGTNLQYYVVWVSAPGEAPVRLGYLPLEGDRKADMSATTVAEQFEILVSAEETESPETPSDHIVIRQGAGREDN